MRPKEQQNFLPTRFAGLATLLTSAYEPIFSQLLTVLLFIRKTFNTGDPYFIFHPVWFE